MSKLRHQDDDSSFQPTSPEQEQQISDPSLPVVHKISKDIESLLEKNRALQDLISEKEQELNDLRAQLTQAGKLAALGTLGASVAHELNNPLTVVAAEADELLDALRTGPPDQHSLHESASNIRTCATRMQAIVDHIRCYTRDEQHTKWQKIDLNQTIHNALLLLRRQLDSAGITVNLVLQADLPDIWGHANKLESVVQNMIVNSRDALRADQHGSAKEIRITTRTVGSDAVQLAIADTGCGMSEDIQAEIFKPFFTTKPAGEGTGLGMSISLEIIAEHNGDIQLRSRPGAGTEFFITFPRDRRGIKPGKRDGQPPGR